jgi:hypothetical protein
MMRSPKATLKRFTPIEIARQTDFSAFRVNAFQPHGEKIRHRQTARQTVRAQKQAAENNPPVDWMDAVVDATTQTLLPAINHLTIPISND